MNHARPEYAITVAIFGVLLAIGIPALKRGSLVVGWIFVGLAIAFAILVFVGIIRERRSL
jgi:hypothetical protein